MRRLISLFIFMAFSFNSFAAEKINYWHKKTLTVPVNYIFSYGFLVNSESRTNAPETNKSIYQAIPARVSAEFGYARGWNYRSSYGKTVLGLRLADKGEGSSINGIIYPVKEDAKFPDSVKSEYGFNLIEVPAKYIEAAGWQQLPKNAKFWTYIVDDKYFRYPDKEHPITQVYLDIALQGFLDYSPEYAKEFLETTQNWSPYWLNDRVMARNPWYFKGQNNDYDMMDSLLEDYFSNYAKGNFFIERKFSEEY